MGCGHGQRSGGAAARWPFRAGPCAQQVAQAASYPRVTFAAEPAESCSLADASCDLVLVAQALHWFDLDPFFAEARRVLKPRGILAAIGYSWFYVDPTIDEIVGRALLKPLEPRWALNNWLLIDSYRGIAFPGEEVRCTPAAIHLAWTREQLVDYVRSWSAVAKWSAQDGSEALDAAFAELAAAWPDGQARHVTMPIISRVARL